MNFSHRILKKFCAIFLCCGLITCSAYGKYSTAYAAGLESAAAGLLGYVPFSTAFWSAAAALGVTGASIAYAVTPDSRTESMTAAEKAAEKAINQTNGLKILSNGAKIVKSYVQGKVNYFSENFMSAVANALNAQGLMSTKSAEYGIANTSYMTIDKSCFMPLSQFLSTGNIRDTYSVGDSWEYFAHIDALGQIQTALGDYTPISIGGVGGNAKSSYGLSLGKYSTISFLVLAIPNSLSIDDVGITGSVGSGSSYYISTGSRNEIFNLSDIKCLYVYLVSSTTPQKFSITDVSEELHSFTGGFANLYKSSISYVLKPFYYAHYYSNALHYEPQYTNQTFFYSYGLFNNVIYTVPWTVTSNTPKFGAAALLETMPTWAGTTTTIPANTVDDTTEAVTGYPVTIPAGDTAIGSSLTADNVQSLTQDEAQAGSIDTTTDITDLSAVVDAISSSAADTAENFDTLFGWLDDILSAVKAIPDSISAAISAAFAFDQSALDGFMLPSSITEKFPFCIPFDIADCLRLFQTSSREAPRYEYTLKYGSQSTVIVLDLSNFDDIAKLIRSLEYIAFLVGLAFASRYLIRG